MGPSLRNINGSRSAVLRPKLGSSTYLIQTAQARHAWFVLASLLVALTCLSLWGVTNITSYTMFLQEVSLIQGQGSQHTRYLMNVNSRTRENINIPVDAKTKYQDIQAHQYSDKKIVEQKAQDKDQDVLQRREQNEKRGLSTPQQRQEAKNGNHHKAAMQDRERLILFREAKKGHERHSSNQAIRNETEKIKDIQTPSYFLTAEDFRGKSDMFAAAWWQSVKRFRRMRVLEVDNNPSAVWQAMNVNKLRDVRLTKDWMEFSVEHLSKLWKLVHFTRRDAGYHFLLEKLLHMIYRSLSSVKTFETANNPWIDTLTLVSYAPIKSEGSFERGVVLDSLVLASQLASVMQHGCGRIVVATNAARLEHITKFVWPKMVRLLKDAQSVSTVPPAKEWESRISWLTTNYANVTVPLGITLGGTQVELVPMEMEDDIRIPRRSVRELHAALFRGTSQYVEQYLGSTPTRWKYIYFTEQDSPVQTRPNVFENFQQSLDSGSLLIPHRWQPLPHESDVSGLPDFLYVPAIGNWTSHTVLTANDKCCDSGLGSYNALTDYPKCSVFWYLCGFGESKKYTDKDGKRAPATERFQRLEQYQLIRIDEGSQITLLAASEHARQCRPSSEPCE